MIVSSRFIAVLTAAVAVSGIASAPALAKSHHPAKSHAKAGKKTLARTAKGGGVVVPLGGRSVAISAFPTGGKGSGTEATCALWTERLEFDQQMVDDAPEADQLDASGPLNTDIDNALDAGCAVIY